MMSIMARPTSPLQRVMLDLSRPATLVDELQQLSPVDRETVLKILDEPYEHVRNPGFWRRGAERRFLDRGPALPTPDVSWYLQEDQGRSSGSSATRLTAEQERCLFLRFNYCRYRVGRLKKKIGARPPRLDDARQLLGWHERAQAARSDIAAANLALVLAMIKRMRPNDVTPSDLISEGNLALLRAIDKFDASRGFKFSTYACRAILAALGRTAAAHAKYRSRYPVEYDPELQQSDFLSARRRETLEDCADEVGQIVRENRADLTEVERAVIRHRFGINGHAGHDEDFQRRTLDEVGRLIGMSKERARQIQKMALDKIRQALEDEYLR
ncbi:MAG: hypothetical protein CMJ18_19380 [Phycisphaeraceae bacterium]|nr:hypothetical protein [Phycisphaeraceae bacterium]